MAAAPGALLSAVTDNRINEFVFKAVLHVLVYAYMELAAIVIERPGTELVYVTGNYLRTPDFFSSLPCPR